MYLMITADTGHFLPPRRRECHWTVNDALAGRSRQRERPAPAGPSWLTWTDSTKATARQAAARGELAAWKSALAPKPKDQRHPSVRDLGHTWDGPGEGQGYEKDHKLIQLTAKSDNPVDWMRMGQGLQRLLLTATRYGVQASLLTQQFEVDDWKRTYERTNPWWPSRRPMMIIRLGYASDPGHPSRRGAGGGPGPL